VPTRIEAQHFGNTKTVSVACGVSHSAAVTEEDALYTWGDGGEASGLGHANREAKWVTTRIAPSLLQGARVGHCHDLPPMHALAFENWERILRLAAAMRRQPWQQVAAARGGRSGSKARHLLRSGSKARRRLLLTRVRTVSMSRCRASWCSGW